MLIAKFLQLRTGYLAGALAVAIASLLFVRFRSGHEEAFLPGVTSDGHHVQEGACQSCHEGFHGVPNDMCLGCHRDQRERDTHAAAMFDDPRWAGALDKLDATKCATCHKEHRIARQGVTVEAAFCFGCHDDVVSRHPTHSAFAPDSCGRGGCHEYHDNSGLDMAFLKAHVREPDQLATPTLLSRDVSLAPSSDAPTPAAHTATKSPPAPDAPVAEFDARITAAWRASAHAAASVNCMDCHKEADGAFLRSPKTSPCARCHEHEAATYGTGKHGVREIAGLSPLTASHARLTMKPSAVGAMSCTTCHDAHGVDTREAAVGACLECHDDQHSRNYPDSKHAKWASVAAAGGLPSSRPPADAVTCATCHMPRELATANDRTYVAVNHDVGHSTHPRSRMARTVCMNCHGMELTFSSVFDDEVVTSNFQKRPSTHHPTVAMIAALISRSAQEGARP